MNSICSGAIASTNFKIVYSNGFSVFGFLMRPLNHFPFHGKLENEPVFCQSITNLYRHGNHNFLIIDGIFFKFGTFKTILYFPNILYIFQLKLPYTLYLCFVFKWLINLKEFSRKLHSFRQYLLHPSWVIFRIL